MAEAAARASWPATCTRSEPRSTQLTPVPVDADSQPDWCHGQAIPCPIAPTTRHGYALETDGTVRAILAYDAEAGLWRPHKVFVTRNE